jgi:DNA-binding NarL/FixJ family response regulator
MLPKQFKLAIADNVTLFSAALKSFLSEQKDIRVIFQAANIPDLLNKLKDSAIDILLMDSYWPDWDVTDVLHSIRGQYPAIKILILSMNPDIELISNLLNCGIRGYVSKADDPGDLLQAIDMIADNHVYRNTLYTEALYWRKHTDRRVFSGEPPAILTAREKKMLRLIWEEKSNKEIADELFLGVRSIEKIRQEIKEKIDAQSTVGMLKYAIRKRIIDIDARQELPEVLNKW